MDQISFDADMYKYILGSFETENDHERNYESPPDLKFNFINQLAYSKLINN